MRPGLFCFHSPCVTALLLLYAFCNLRQVDHPCYRCQTDIPEGTAFCPHCGAPQIRVAPPEGEAPLESAVPPEAAPQYVAQQSVAWTQGSAPYQAAPGIIQWDIAWKSAMLCGVGAALLSAIPFVSLGCCLWMLGAGAMTVSLYRKRVPDAVITPGMGMRLGALSGIFGFFINAIVTTIAFMAQRSNGTFRQAMEEQMKKQMANTPDPKAQEIMQRMIDWMATPQGAATTMILVLVFMGVIFLLFTAAGGALGASMRGSRREFR